MPSNFDDLWKPFETLEELEAFYADPAHDMTLHFEALRFAVENPEKRVRVLEVAPGAVQEATERKRDVALWRYFQAAVAKPWSPQWQKRGTCVGQGAKGVADFIVSINHVFAGGRFPGRVAVAPLYAGSRVDIGGRPGNWDGSTGFWVVEWMKKFGLVFLKDLDLPEDSLDEDERLGVRWTASRSGVPADIESIAKSTPIEATYVVEDPDEAEAVVDAGGLVLTCSDLIATGKRGQYGLSPVRRQGGHCQFIGGKHYTPDGQRVWTQINSWDGWGDGPVFPSDQPKGSVNLSDQSFAAQLRSGDCHAVVGVRGLDPLKDSDLFIL